MNTNTVKQIISLNKEFYKKTNEGRSFSSTRQSSWVGWERLASVIKDNKKSHIYSVLDIGCGNGRFYNELIRNKNWKDLLEADFRYLGVDSDKEMLKEGSGKYEKAVFVESDVISNFESEVFVDKIYDLVVSFGVSHHIPFEELRMDWFSNLADLVKEDGILCITTWQFLKSKQFSYAKKEINNGKYLIKEEDIGVNDYFLGWNNEKELYRYCHYYDDNEIEKIMSLLNEKGLSLVETFFEDGKDRTLNKYLIFKRRSL